MMEYVITGGPCTGKTTLINALEQRGYAVVSESARQIIMEEQQKEFGILPWKHHGSFFVFQQLVLRRQMDLENRLKADICFLDRGVVDGVAYCNLAGSIAPDEVLLYACINRYDGVFLLDRLAYKKDSERVEDESTAVRIHHLIEEAYRKYKYEIINVPVLPVEQRVDFVLDKIKKQTR